MKNQSTVRYRTFQLRYGGQGRTYHGVRQQHRQPFGTVTPTGGYGSHYSDSGSHYPDLEYERYHGPYLSWKVRYRTFFWFSAKINEQTL